jgi:hypothetical protein
MPKGGKVKGPSQPQLGKIPRKKVASHTGAVVVRHSANQKRQTGVENILGSISQAAGSNRSLYGKPVDARKLFGAIDTDGDQTIDRGEMDAALHRLGIPATSRQVKDVFSAADVDHDGHVTRDEFEAAMQRLNDAQRASSRKHAALAPLTQSPAVARALDGAALRRASVGDLSPSPMAAVQSGLATLRQSSPSAIPRHPPVPSPSPTQAPRQHGPPSPAQAWENMENLDPLFPPGGAGLKPLKGAPPPPQPQLTTPNGKSRSPFQVDAGVEGCQDPEAMQSPALARDAVAVATLAAYKQTLSEAQRGNERYQTELDVAQHGRASLEGQLAEANAERAAAARRLAEVEAYNGSLEEQLQGVEKYLSGPSRGV